jgi:hypothetical protein
VNPFYDLSKAVLSHKSVQLLINIAGWISPQFYSNNGSVHLVTLSFGITSQYAPVCKRAGKLNSAEI